MRNTLQVDLFDHTTDPIRTLYEAYKAAYSKNTPQETHQHTEVRWYAQGERKRMEDFIRERLATGHTSPLEQVSFEFAISGVSRAFSHQFVRTRVGMSVEQQSQRYVTLKDGDFTYVTPPSIQKASPEVQRRYINLMNDIGQFYGLAVGEGVPAEDARFALPNAATTNLKVVINFAALRYMSSIRLCTRAQAEYRAVVAKMGARVREKFPLLGEYLAIKCQPNGTLGMCDEDFKAYQDCPVSKARYAPVHKSMLAELRVIRGGR